MQGCLRQLVNPPLLQTYPLVSAKLPALIRCVLPRKPIENHLFFQDFQLVKGHQHLQPSENSSWGLQNRQLFWD